MTHNVTWCHVPSGKKYCLKISKGRVGRAPPCRKRPVRRMSMTRSAIILIPTRREHHTRSMKQCTRVRKRPARRRKSCTYYAILFEQTARVHLCKKYTRRLMHKVHPYTSAWSRPIQTTAFGVVFFRVVEASLWADGRSFHLLMSLDGIDPVQLDFWPCESKPECSSILSGALVPDSLVSGCVTWAAIMSLRQAVIVSPRMPLISTSSSLPAVRACRMLYRSSSWSVNPCL